MNTSMAHELAVKSAQLIELTSIFQSQYGKDYRMKPGSPEAAWEVQQAIFDLQGTLARLLDPYALENPLRRMTPWWKHQDVMDTGVATQIAQEVFHLIACCASQEYSTRGEPSPVIICSQRTIAGLLHSSSLLIALSDLEKARIAS
jgi:hypothetical protein